MSAFSQQSSGVGSFLFGSVLIIMIAAVGFSALNNNLFASTSTAELNEERAGRIHDQGVQISQLRIEIAREKTYLVEQKATLKPMIEAGRLNAELEKQQAKVADLQLEASSREDTIEELGHERARHRVRVRAHLWPLSLNRELKAEHLVGELPYRNPKISKIDAAGLMVRHEGGSTRIEVSELSKEFREKLDLDVSEARKVMTEMLIQDARAKSSRRKKEVLADQPSAYEIEEMVAEKLMEGKIRVNKYLDLIHRADEAARVARHNDRYSSSRSVPGKLETWGARAQKFEAASLKYRQQLNAVVEGVLKLDPDFKIPQQ